MLALILLSWRRAAHPHICNNLGNHILQNISCSECWFSGIWWDSSRREQNLGFLSCSGTGDWVQMSFLWMLSHHSSACLCIHLLKEGHKCDFIEYFWWIYVVINPRECTKQCFQLTQAFPPGRISWLSFIILFQTCLTEKVILVIFFLLLLYFFAANKPFFQTSSLLRAAKCQRQS